MTLKPNHPTSALLETGLVVAVVLAVAGFGGTEKISWGIVQGILLLLVLLLLLRPPIAPPQVRARAWIAPAALALIVAIRFLPGLGGVGALDASAAREQVLLLLAYGCAFGVAFTVARAPQARWRLVIALVALGLAEALYGLVQYLTGWQQIFTYVKQYYVEDATGTYINHNHFAGLLEMLIPLSVAMALAYGARALRSSGHRSAHPLRELFGHASLQKCMLLAFVALVALLAVVFSRSRMGLISCVFSLLAMAALSATRRGSRPLAGLLLVGLLAACIGFTFWIGVEPIVNRFSLLAEQESPHRQGGGRLAIARDTLRLIERHPWLGVGPGGFETAYTQEQTVHLDSTVDHAHNDYLELTAELGLPGAGLLFGMIFAAAARTLHASYGHPESAGRILALGSFAGIAALLLHSFADFNLFIPANGLVFTVLLGMGCSIAVDLRSR